MIVNKTMRTVKVTPFLQSLGSVSKVPIITAAIAYDDPKSGNVFVLLIHQALYFQDLDHCLLCPMQLRLNDVVVNERPKFLTERPSEDDHVIRCEEVTIPLELHGVTSYFKARRPTKDEYLNCDRFELTYPDPEWIPSDSKYSEEESRFVSFDGSLVQAERYLFAYETFDEARFISGFCQMKTRDNASLDDISSLVTKKSSLLSSETLSMRWGIGLQVAERTLKATTQKAVKTVAYPNVERQWPTGDRPLRYKKLNHQVFHDTLHARTPSLRGNKCAEIYATDFGWSRVFPMKKVSEVHETPDMFLSRYGIPEALVSDGAKAYLGGNFKKKAREACVFCKLTDPYSPWQNRAEGEIREV